MKLNLDRYADLSSPIHRWEMRSKFVGLLALIFAFAFVQKLVLLPAMIFVTVLLFVLSRLPLSFLLNRLRYPGLFIAGVVMFLPFLGGETILFHLGGIAVKEEGCLAVLLIVTRFVCILTVSLILFGTAPFLSSIKALRSLGLPGVIADMLLLTYRYLEQLGETLGTMQRAMQLRGFRRDLKRDLPSAVRGNRRNLSQLAGLAGSLLTRSYEQSERVYHAMLLRGYGHSRQTPKPLLNQHNTTSFVGLGLILFVAASFAIAEIFLPA
ncbi:cobalt ECF transporter T component CbiQ [Lusitaniella coriacea LEGE 07157]|uniref:Cobalt ECF transporter T component CbiQ n=2 Tax=Lusitaniella TaxID=1983104 RepID=A0A8J7DVR0_9CYAN|nr:cobalt ECF transporter T component CbiQ [Lusitaniella coriacea]MBE9115898.1 cobalt ECF transporter T component CbiQ [Lusitaniella coriacea LEGE 07157]